MCNALCNKNFQSLSFRCKKAERLLQITRRKNFVKQSTTSSSMMMHSRLSLFWQNFGLTFNDIFGSRSVHLILGYIRLQHLVKHVDFALKQNSSFFVIHVQAFQSTPNKLTDTETHWSSGNLTTNFEPARSSESFKGRNRQTTRMLSSQGRSLSLAGLAASPGSPIFAFGVGQGLAKSFFKFLFVKSSFD